MLGPKRQAITPLHCLPTHNCLLHSDPPYRVSGCCSNYTISTNVVHDCFQTFRKLYTHTHATHMQHTHTPHTQYYVNLECQAELQQFVVASCSVAVDLGIVWVSLGGLIIVFHCLWKPPYTTTTQTYDSNSKYTKTETSVST